MRTAVEGIYHGSLGWTVRCTPRRRTVRVDAPVELFGKWRQGAAGDAAREWHWLHVLPLMGLAVPQPVCWLGSRRRSLLVTAGVGGRGLDGWMVDADREGWLDELCEYALVHVAPAIRRLHDNRIAYRDLYWNHLLVEDPRAGDPPVFVDVERAFRPRWRWRRWVVKDLAGLLSSLTVRIPDRWLLRFVRRYQEGAAFDPALLDDIMTKAARIRAHRPKYG
ncbi:MAG: hypothetical protein NXI31_11975 [bacterium]|nr:hypothetical protein [bacterium]